jgi:lipoyl(octanoyl) transferase
MNAQKIPRLCELKIQAITPYALAWSQQRALVEARIANPNLPDVLLLLEHPPVYTLVLVQILSLLNLILTKPTKKCIESSEEAKSPITVRGS